MTSLNMLETVGIQMNVLIQELNENFPPVTPKPNDSNAKIMYQAGQRSVIEWIQNRMDENNVY